jgi:glycosyltransferase involved in cell wall biosynthesis
MPDKKLTLTIVIPAYNEERYLPDCLEAIKKQTVQPDEVIVVNNNSTDRTVEIAEKYKFVKLLHEKRQHQAFAQIKGFESAKSDIIARIDADTILPKDWVKKIKAAMANEEIVGISGRGEFFDVPLKAIADVFFNFYHSQVAGLIAGHRMMWGSNCAFRASLWPKISSNLLRRSDIWEDYDLAFCLSAYGRIVQLKGIKVGCSFRSAHKSARQLISYQFRGMRTFWLRTNVLRAAVFTVVWLSLVIFIPIASLDRFILRSRK